MAKKIFYFFIYSTLISYTGLQANAVIINFPQLDSLLDNQSFQQSNSQLLPIQIRGFVYKLQSGNQILAPTPDLKTCCIEDAGKKLSYILIVNELEGVVVPGVAVTLEGDLKLGAYQEFPFALENARLINEPTRFPFNIWGIAILFLCFAACILTVVKNRTSRQARV